MTISSEVIDDPDEPETTRRRSDADPDWTPCDAKEKKKPATFTVTFEQETWFKNIVGSVDRAELSGERCFYIFKDLFSKNGANLDDIILSPSSIAKWRQEAEIKNESNLKVTAAFLKLGQRCILMHDCMIA